MTLLGILLGVAVLLTYAMFHTRNGLLGFPAAIFWAIGGGQAYTMFTIAWVDIEYYVFFASEGVAIFTMFAAYTLRKKDLDNPEIGEGEMIDEQGETKEPEEPKEFDTDELDRRSAKRGKNRRYFK